MGGVSLCLLCVSSKRRHHLEKRNPDDMVLHHEKIVECNSMFKFLEQSEESLLN